MVSTAKSSFRIVDCELIEHQAIEMAYVVPIHKASSVRHAIKLQFLNPEEESLVVALVTTIHRSASGCKAHVTNISNLS